MNYLQACERSTLHVSDYKSKIASIDIQTIKDGVALENGKAIIRYQLDNHLGSACLELDGKAEIISYEEYHPFGISSYRSLYVASENGSSSILVVQYFNYPVIDKTTFFLNKLKLALPYICLFIFLSLFTLPSVKPLFASNSIAAFTASASSIRPLTKELSLLKLVFFIFSIHSLSFRDDFDLNTSLNSIDNSHRHKSLLLPFFNLF